MASHLQSFFPRPAAQPRSSASARPGGRFRPGLPRALLVFETTGFALHAVVARRGFDGSLRLGAPVVSAAVDAASAVGEVLAQLRAAAGRRLPKAAVLITPAAVGERLLLPVDPRKPRPRAQMGELVRWELEEVFVRQSELWSLGALLQGRGYLGADERRELEESAGRDRGALVEALRRRVSRGRMEECLTMQEALAGLDDELALGWCGQPGAEEDGRFAWYGAGIGAGLRARWVQAFRAHGIFCDWIYPQLGAALPLAGADRGDRVLVEVRQEQFGVFAWRGGRLDVLAIQSCQHGVATPEALAAAVRAAAPEARVVRVAGPAGCADPLRAALGGVEVCAVGGGLADSCPPEVAASLEGVARHALKLCPAELLVRIEAQAPRPPLWKSREFWPWAAIGLVVLGVVATEVTLQVRARRKEWQLELLDIEYERQMQIKGEAQRMQAEVRKFETALAEKERELAAKRQRRAVLDDVILYRQRFVPEFLRVLGEASAGEVLLDVVEEDPDRTGFQLEGWALTGTEAQRFGNQLNEGLAPLGYKLADIRLSRGRERGAGDGFVVKIRLAKLENPPSNAAASAPPRVAARKPAAKPAKGGKRP